MMLLATGKRRAAECPTEVESAQWTGGGRCYDHNFLRFLTIFGEKIGVFLKNQCYDQNFAYFCFVLSQNGNIFTEFFGENI
jgi:hypothetical protein